MWRRAAGELLIADFWSALLLGLLTMRFECTAKEVNAARACVLIMRLSM